MVWGPRFVPVTIFQLHGSATSISVDGRHSPPHPSEHRARFLCRPSACPTFSVTLDHSRRETPSRLKRYISPSLFLCRARNDFKIFQISQLFHNICLFLSRGKWQLILQLGISTSFLARNPPSFGPSSFTRGHGHINDGAARARARPRPRPCVH